ncbi:hypothetical protein INT44_008384 [Umbelopsis vinacea]|uniref:Uncharacterized protein n=1 Tax=Umbelopsis vinacea TaxID=44442 RepID=A0A8H7UJT6_9FUNG|nr:hypothetical protein INT44_008384 [Umbelopsis vinacea]
MSSATEKHADHVVDEKQGTADLFEKDEIVKEEVLEYDSIDYENDPEYKDIPLIVRELVTFEDDPETPSLTFRYFLLSIIFVGLGAFVSQLSWFRTTSAPYSVFFVQIVTHWAGKWLARVLPNKVINLYLFSFNLNPGPFSRKEHVLITLSASAGATSNLGEIIVSVKELFYDEYMHPVAAIAFMWATIWTGYSYAALARSFLIYDPTFVWPQALMQTTLFNTLRAESDENDSTVRKQMKVFWLCLVGVFFWQFLPEYAFPLTSSLAVLCWFGGHNEVVAFVGSGLGGMGVLNFTLDWSNITSAIMLSPWWTQVIQFVAFVLSVWVLVPIAKFNGLWGSDKIPLMSNRLFLANGTAYPFTKLITPDAQFNETAYEEYGPVYMSAYNMWTIFFGYASYLSAFVSIALFAGPKLVLVAKTLIKRGKRENTDKLNKLMEPYKDVPLWWYLVLFLICFITNMVLIFTEQLYIPWWSFLVALVIGAASVVPMGNYQVDIGTFNELIYGYMLNANGNSRHPIGSLVYRVVAGQCWYRAQTILQDMKIGHYNHVAPRDVFWSQIIGNVIGVPINYAVIRWVIDTKRDFLDGTKKDPLNQWTGQNPISYNSQAVQYGLVGPSRLFELSVYTPLLYGFLLGVVAPVLLWLLHKKFPKARFDLWNTTIFFSSMGNFYGNVSTGPLSSIIGGFVCNFYFYRYRHAVWKKYNYLCGAALDAGFNLNMLAIFIFFSAAKTVVMPPWWGNDPVSVEKCYAL